ncbi:hypothetical protein [Streptomyces sp. gb14]|uniref:hypothetical protein n=1 Tax=Streptomyces sp. gb14 TaxID=1827753 RepID=UPI0015CF2213|nr:hypothetical protein [Streptomyces sp. gb14]
MKVPRQHTGIIVIDGQEHHIKAGVFLSHHKSRRAKLSDQQCEQLAALGIDWAATT